MNKSGGGAYVSIPKDLTKVKNKLLFSLTKRQLVCFGSAALVGVPLYLLLRGITGGDVAVIVMIAAMLPFFFLGVYEKDGQSAERVLRNILRHTLWRGVRPYKTNNLYNNLRKGNKHIAVKTTHKSASNVKSQKRRQASTRGKAGR
jgi:hypothetical protein